KAPPRVTVHSGGFWAAAAPSGPTWGGTGPKRTVPSSSFHPDQSQPPEPPVLAGKCKNPTEFNPKFKELDLPPPATDSTSKVSRGVGYPALRQTPYVALVVPAETLPNFRQKVPVFSEWARHRGDVRNPKDSSRNMEKFGAGPFKSLEAQL
ncbi:AP2/B3-like transcriptional factor family protein, partial [Prunus dulcis]